MLTSANLLRFTIGIFGVVMFVVAVLFALQTQSAIDLWPWDSYNDQLEPLSLYFISSIALAIAAPLIWTTITGKMQAAPGGALNLAVTFGGISGFMFLAYQADSSNARLPTAALFFAVSAIANFVGFIVLSKQKTEDSMALPLPIRFSFAAFILILLLVGGALVMKRPNIMPWGLTPEASVIYGWVFLGASLYFAYALRKPLWENAEGPLIGFLAYDIILLPPFLMHFENVQPEQRTSLILYTAVVLYSAILACYYLFVNRDTRLRLRRAAVG